MTRRAWFASHCASLKNGENAASVAVMSTAMPSGDMRRPLSGNSSANSPAHVSSKAFLKQKQRAENAEKMIPPHLVSSLDPLEPGAGESPFCAFQGENAGIFSPEKPKNVIPPMPARGRGRSPDAGESPLGGAQMRGSHFFGIFSPEKLKSSRKESFFRHFQP